MDCLSLDLKTKSYLEKILERDMENWIIWTDTWINAWKGENNCKIFIDITNNGFVLMNDKHLEFAYVNKEYRKCGILRRMMNDVFKYYRGSNLGLSSIDELTDKIWERFGFICIRPRKNISHCSEYELLFC